MDKRNNEKEINMWTKLTELWNAFKKLFKSEPKPDPDPIYDDIEVSKIHWRSQTEPTGLNAKATCRLRNVSRKGGTIYFTHDARKWHIDSGEKCDCTICLFKINADGTADGGKFDHDYPNTTSKPLNHMVENGYLDNRHPSEPKILPPVAGDTWMLCQVSYDGTERTEFRKFTW
jgi:hypothetical protein